MFTRRALTVVGTADYNSFAFFFTSVGEFLVAHSEAELRKKGVIAQLDGLNVVKIASNRLPEKFGFMIAHPVATVAPVKLAEYKIHLDPPFLSGSLVEGRIYYDAFVLENKAKGIYYQATT